MSRVGIYGGTFDPIHRGHLHVITQLFEKDLIDQLLLVPAGQPLLRVLEPTASAEQRPRGKNRPENLSGPFLRLGEVPEHLDGPDRVHSRGQPRPQGGEEPAGRGGDVPGFRGEQGIRHAGGARARHAHSRRAQREHTVLMEARAARGMKVEK